MGQLEKYGLYVLCLVIFLILGVTIWGDPAGQPPGQRNESVPIRVSAGNAQLGRGELPDLSGVGGNRAGPDSGLGMVDSLLMPEKPIQLPKNTVSAPVAKDAPVVDSGLRNTLDRNGNGEDGGGAKSTADDPRNKPAPQPVAVTREYTVRKGDTLGLIAQKQLGSVRHLDRLRALNPGIGDNLSIGQVLILSARDGDSSKGVVNASVVTKSSAEHRTYTISKGDSFDRIARVELGSSARAKEIIGLNPNVDPLRLQPGMKVKLPLK